MRRLTQKTFQYSNYSADFQFEWSVSVCVSAGLKTEIQSLFKKKNDFFIVFYHFVSIS